MQNMVASREALIIAGKRCRLDLIPKLAHASRSRMIDMPSLIGNTTCSNFG